VNAEAPRLIGGGGDDAALGRVAMAANNHRLAAQLGMPLLLYGNEEGIHIDMQDLLHSISLLELTAAAPRSA
jgi:hypothetical protein